MRTTGTTNDDDNCVIQNRSSEFVKSAVCVRATDFWNSVSGYVRECCSFADFKSEIKSRLKIDPITSQSHPNTNLISRDLIGIVAVFLFLVNSDYLLSRNCFFSTIVFISLTVILSPSPAPRQCDYKRITLCNLLQLPSKHTNQQKHKFLSQKLKPVPYAQVPLHWNWK